MVAIDPVRLHFFKRESEIPVKPTCQRGRRNLKSCEKSMSFKIPSPCTAPCVLTLSCWFLKVLKSNILWENKRERAWSCNWKMHAFVRQNLFTSSKYFITSHVCVVPGMFDFKSFYTTKMFLSEDKLHNVLFRLTSIAMPLIHLFPIKHRDFPLPCLVFPESQG